VLTVAAAPLVVGFGTAIQLRSPGRPPGAGLLGRRHAGRDAQIVSIALGAAIPTVVDYGVSIAIMAVVTAVCGSDLAAVGAPDDR